MDETIKKQHEKLMQEIEAKNNAIEAEKVTFEQELKNGLGEEIKSYLQNPPKPNFWLAFKLKIQRLILKIKEYFKKK